MRTDCKHKSGLLCYLMTIIGLFFMSCESHYDDSTKWRAAEMEFSGIQLVADLKYPFKMYGTIPPSGLQFLVRPSQVQLNHYEAENLDLLPDALGSQFFPELTIGGEWYWRTDWMWVERLWNEESGDFEYVVNIDRNTSGTQRTLGLYFSGAYLCRDILLTQEAER